MSDPSQRESRCDGAERSCAGAGSAGAHPGPGGPSPDGSHAPGQDRGKAARWMSSALCGRARGARTANLSGLASSTAPVVLFGDGSREPQMEQNTGVGWRRSETRTEPSVCGRLVGSTLVRVAHRPIHPAKTAQLGPPVMPAAQSKEPLTHLEPAADSVQAAPIERLCRCAGNGTEVSLASTEEPVPSSHATGIMWKL